MVNVTLISTVEGDWSGLYADNDLFTEGHSISETDWLNFIVEYKNFSTYEIYEIDMEDIEELGCNFPDKLSKIPRSYLI